jgi:hypothetical protein
LKSDQSTPLDALGLVGELLRDTNGDVAHATRLDHPGPLKDRLLDPRRASNLNWWFGRREQPPSDRGHSDVTGMSEAPEGKIAEIDHGRSGRFASFYCVVQFVLLAISPSAINRG